MSKAARNKKNRLQKRRAQLNAKLNPPIREFTFSEVLTAFFHAHNMNSDFQGPGEEKATRELNDTLMTLDIKSPKIHVFFTGRRAAAFYERYPSAYVIVIDPTLLPDHPFEISPYAFAKLIEDLLSDFKGFMKALETQTVVAPLSLIEAMYGTFFDLLGNAGWREAGTHLYDPSASDSVLSEV